MNLVKKIAKKAGLFHSRGTPPDPQKIMLARVYLRKKSAEVVFTPPVRLSDLTIKGSLELGAYTYIRGGAIGAGLKSIGHFCSIAPGLRVGDGDHPVDWLSTHPFQYRGVTFRDWPEYVDFDAMERGPQQKPPTTIGSDVWIGANVTIVRGVNIGHGAVIGAGAVVTHDVKPYEIVAGIPARHLRFRFDDKTIERLLALEWWNYTLKSLEGISFDDIDAALDELERRKAAGLLALRDDKKYRYGVEGTVTDVPAKGIFG